MSRPNILFFFTDQHRADTLGCYGAPVCRTPVLDRLAHDGVCFDAAYTPSAICTPARASLLTGLWPHHHLLLANHERNVGYRTELDDAFEPFSRPLRAQGYRVGSVGKWHVGETKGPEDHGFEGTFYPGWGDPIDHPDYLAYLRQHGLPSFRVRHIIRGVLPNGQPGIPIGGVYEGPLEGTWSYFLAERTIERLREYARHRRETGTPFFLSCHFFGPHLPYFLPEEYAHLYAPDEVTLPKNTCETFDGKPRVQRNYCAHWGWDTLSEAQQRQLIAMYWGYVTLIDEQIGRVLDELDALGLSEETALFFAADHGEFTGSHRLHDKGPAMYEEIYRVPLLGSVPGGARGVVRREFVSLLDLTATFVDLAGAPVPSHYDGRSLLPFLRGEDVPTWRQEITAEFHGHHFPYPQRMIRNDRYKLVVNPPDVNELYDLLTDPHELVNRIDDPALAHVRRDLARRLYRRLKESGDNFYHWMTTTMEVDESAANASLSPMDSAAT
ncbi:MAG: sulfatase-like hydrolase/transferase [Armatimonadota bacterium]|nr:sulfatase-like hydrolase/transferase [Armatimonadota bacterium]